MKVISLYQPYATLVVIGAKQFETRSWDTNYRGPLAIHATKNTPIWCKELLSESPFKRVLKGVELPTGVILGYVEVVNTVRTETLANIDNYDFYAKDEYWFGDYSSGRFAWELRNPVKFDNPVPAKGSQGFWNFDLTTYTHGQLGIQVSG